MPQETNDTNVSDKGAEGKEEMVSKAQFDELNEKTSKLEKELESTRAETFTEDYLNFITEKETKGKETPKDTVLKPEELDFEKLSKKEIYERAKADAKKEISTNLTTFEETHQKEKEESIRKEIAAFARSHVDFERYRPTMYGLSKDPVNKDKTLQELYEDAKSHVVRVYTESTKEERERAEKLKGEKPGGHSDSYERLAKLSEQEAAKEALSEVKEKLGSIPIA